MKTLFKERAKRFYGNQHVKRWIRNPFRKYVINPTVKATKVTGFIIVSVFVFMLVANILQSAWFEKDVEAAENATSTPMTASSTPKFSKAEFKKIYENYPFPPFLLKICRAEHAGGHYDANGQVIINASRDIGECQINVPIWGKEATNLGYDLSVREDNRQFALYLFLTHGTKPWYLSQVRWDK